MESACNHEVKDKPHVIFEANTDSLAQVPQLNDYFPIGGGKWRNGRAKQERRFNQDSFEGLTLNSVLKSVEVDSDVW